MISRAQAALKKVQETQTVMARKLGMSQSTLNDLLNSEATPTLKKAAIIEIVYKIPMRWWLEPAEKTPKNAA